MTMNVFEKIEEGLKDALVIAEGAMTDGEIVDALRAWASLVSSGYEVPAAGSVMNSAADEIERLRKEVQEALSLMDANEDAARAACIEARNKALEEVLAIVDHAMPADPSDGDADSVRICERIMDEINQRIAALKDRAP
jgi:chaperonin GroEL (HSP60 family)